MQTEEELAEQQRQEEEQGRQEEEQRRPQSPEGDNSVIRDLRTKAGKVPDLERENAELKRKLATRDVVDKLGIPADKREKFDRLAERLIDDEPTEDKLRGLATEYGFLAPTQEIVEEGQRLEAAASTHVGAVTPTPTEPEVLSKQIREAQSPEQVLELSRKAGVPIAGE
jgi:hypothetical protein